MNAARKTLIVIVGGIFCFACGTVPQPAANVEPVATPAPTIDIAVKKTFEDDLAYVRGGGFIYVFILRRKDGATWAKEDTAFLKDNSPFETNQRLLSDNGKAVIVGTNFRFRPGQWDALNRQFDLQDMSPDKYVKNENDALATMTPALAASPTPKHPLP